MDKDKTNKKDNISIVRPDDCCGCEACDQICPKQCISMEELSDGFIHPVVNENKCVHCGMCTKTCPVLDKSEGIRPIRALAAYNTNDIDRLESSSGGMFIALARNIIEGGGVVCGVVFDNNWMPHHVCAEKIDDVYPMMGSKYVQSRTERVYRDCLDYLKAGRKVLFTGTPCQTAALHHFLRNRSYPNLISVDVICHGVPSPAIWRRYLSETFGEGYDKSRRKATVGKNSVLDLSLNNMPQIGGIKFRDKSTGWEKFSFVVRKKSASKADKNAVLLSELSSKNPYFLGFVGDLYLRESCYHCPARPYKSYSDLTIGDFWGVNKLGYSSINDDKGLSIVIVNTENGDKIIKAIAPRIKMLDITLQQAEESNSNIFSHMRKKNKRRIRKFIRLKKRTPLSEAVEKSLKVNYFLRKWWGLQNNIKSIKEFLEKV